MRSQSCEKRLLASCLLSIRRSVRMEQLGFQGTDFNKILYLSTFWKHVEKIQVSMKSDQNNGYFTWSVWAYLAQFFLEWQMFQREVVEKTKTYILCSITPFFQKSCHLWDNVEICWRAGQATDDNTIRHMQFACQITKATNTHPKYIICVAFPLQQWLHERA